jgi:hypothetical protein
MMGTQGWQTGSKMWLRFGLLSGACFVLAACSGQSGITGSYIGGDDNARVMVQINSLKDHEITGTVTAVSVSGDGRVAAVNKPVSGTIDSKIVNLNVENGSGLSLITGTLDDTGLSLTFFGKDSSQKLLLERRDPIEFAALTEGVRRHAAAIQQAALEGQSKAARMGRLAADQAQVFDFARDMTTKADSVMEGVVQINRIAASYSDLSIRAVRLGGVSTRLAAYPGDASGQIQEVDYAKERNADAAQSRHQSVLNASRTLAEASRQHDERAETLTALCTASPELDCRGIAAAINVYRARAVVLRAAIDHENNTFEAVRSKL